jgi:hypothetical protein
MALPREGDGRAFPELHQCTSEDDFVESLRWWLEKTDEDTVGDVDPFPGKPWVRVTIGDVPCHLNADSNRVGVESFLSTVAQEGGATFSVVANARGNVNKVAFGKDKKILPYFYLYTDKNLPAPRAL